MRPSPDALRRPARRRPPRPAGRWAAAAVLAAVISASCQPPQPDPPLPPETPAATEGPWEPLEPQAPPTDSPDRPALAQLLVRGRGPAVGMGNLVELRLVATGRALATSPTSGAAASAAASAPPKHDRGGGWVWIGFDGLHPSDFPVGGNGLADALLGRLQGDVLTLRARAGARDPASAGSARVLVFGDPAQYLAHKPAAAIAPTNVVSATGGIGRDGTAVEIARVCLGRAEQRLVTLRVGTPTPVVESGSPRRAGGQQLFVREARWTGICQDGRHASFRYGPIAVEPPPGRGPGATPGAPSQPWLDGAWRQLPVGVVVD